MGASKEEWTQVQELISGSSWELSNKRLYRLARLLIMVPILLLTLFMVSIFVWFLWIDIPALSLILGFLGFVTLVFLPYGFRINRNARLLRGMIYNKYPALSWKHTKVLNERFNDEGMKFIHGRETLHSNTIYRNIWGMKSGYHEYYRFSGTSLQLSVRRDTTVIELGRITSKNKEVAKRIINILDEVMQG